MCTETAVGICSYVVEACPVVDAGTPPTTCKTDTDCGTGKLCGFNTADGCSAVGTCVSPTTGPQCTAVYEVCTCAGGTTTGGCTAYPAGYLAAPVPNANARAVGGVCGAVDAGPAPCSKNSDCAGVDVCAFTISDGCSAVGTCVAPGPTCASDVVLPACTCGGKVINVACSAGYPTGTASAPVQHSGSCDGGA